MRQRVATYTSRLFSCCAFLAATVALSSARLSSASDSGSAAPSPAGAWTLTWSDEFDGTALNASNWDVYNNMTHGPQELQLYLADGVSVSDGSLTITTRSRDAMYGDKKYHYTSGWVETQHKFSQRFGRFEARARLPDPRVNAIWPAFWLMPEPETAQPPNVCWPVGGEIDILEATGGNWNNTVYGTFHWANQCGNDLYKGKNGKYPDVAGGAAPIDFSLDFHVFAVEWNATAIEWFVDGNHYHTRTPSTCEIPQTPFYIILNTAMAFFGVEPTPASDKFLPATFDIDYVRVYSKEAH